MSSEDFSSDAGIPVRSRPVWHALAGHLTIICMTIGSQLIRAQDLHLTSTSVSQELFTTDQLATPPIEGQACQSLVAPTLATLTAEFPDRWLFTISSGALAGGPGFDYLVADFYSPNFGSFPLGTGANSNYSTCAQCVLFVRDEASPNSKIFFQSAGILHINQPPFSNPLEIQLFNVKLVESTIDENSNSTPVPGGECYDLVPNRIFQSSFDG